MVPFAGYSMPLSYGSVGAGQHYFAFFVEEQWRWAQFVVASHHHVRKSVGLFDVGHMVQSKWAFILIPYWIVKLKRISFLGPGATAFLEWLTPSSLTSLSPYSSTLSVLLNEKGGIIDDTIITKHAENAFYVVTNAGRRERDLAWFKEKLEEWNASERASPIGPVQHEVLEDWGLLALQGMFACCF